MGSGMMSYPSFQFKDKALDHPDVYALALFAEKSNLDFRVIVLCRQAADILKSTAKRKFGTPLEPEPRVLVDNAAALYTQMKLMDPRFFLSFDFDSLVRSDWVAMIDKRKHQIANFLHPGNLVVTLLCCAVQLGLPNVSALLFSSSFPFRLLFLKATPDL